LINELKDSNVTITALVPGPTDTDFFNKANAEDTVAANASLSTPQEVASEGYKALLAGEHRVIVGMKNKAMVASSNLMPDELVTAAGRAQMEEKH
ncbi:MAG TPA: short-chain dehydrogenase, partial [Cytophagaceae bacterium]